MATFDSYPVVGLDEDHHNDHEHAFLLSLIRNPQFAAVVNDIVVEFGNARHQPLIDRFTNGEDVPIDILRQVWQDTTVPGDTWDVPLYERFYREVRAVNAERPIESRLRVVLGDPPIDGRAVNSADDYARWAYDRDTHAASVIRREVIDNDRRALNGGLQRCGPANVWLEKGEICSIASETHFVAAGRAIIVRRPIGESS